MKGIIVQCILIHHEHHRLDKVAFLCALQGVPTRRDADANLNVRYPVH